MTSDILVGDVASPSQIRQPSLPSTRAQMRAAYGVSLLPDSGAGQTIAIVDAYNDPTIISDANAFSSQFGLTAVQRLRRTDLDGAQPDRAARPLPANATAGTGEWDIEESLDVEWAHSIAPNANIVLFEANSACGYRPVPAIQRLPTIKGRLRRLDELRQLGVPGRERLGSDLHDAVRAIKGVTFLAATGRRAAPSGYPAYSPNVVAVGGTTLNISANGIYVSESGWSDGAGGVSNDEPQPAYQIGKVNGTNNTNRTNPDVSMDADPNTGVFVVDSFLTGSTSACPGGRRNEPGAPMWAGLIALADQVRANVGQTSLDGPSQTLPRLYNLPSNDFHDITTGNNGFPATAGYDLVTGIGTPVANLLVPDLAQVQTAGGPRRHALRSPEIRFPRTAGRPRLRRPFRPSRTSPSRSLCGFRGRPRSARSTRSRRRKSRSRRARSAAASQSQGSTTKSTRAI